MVVQLRVIGPRGEEVIIDLCDTEEQFKSITVLQLKEKITETLSISEDLRLVFCTERLEDSALLSEYGIRHMSTIITLLFLPGGGGDPGKGHGGMGDKDGKTQSMERLADFEKPTSCSLL